MIDKQSILNMFKDLKVKIEEGVTLPNGVKRPYDILDYTLTTKIDLNKLFEVVIHDLTKEEVITLKHFLNKNHLGKKIDAHEIKQIFSIQEENNTKRDELGNPIPGTGRIITNEEKKMILDFMVNNNLLYSKIYKLAKERIINGELIFTQNEPKQRKV